MDRSIKPAQRRLTHLFAGYAVLALAACDVAASTSSDGCLSLVVTVDPATTSVAVGQSVQLTASLAQGSAGCTAGFSVSALRWMTDDTTVAVVDSTAGVVTGVRPGRTGVSVHQTDSTRVLGVGQIRVTAP